MNNRLFAVIPCAGVGARSGAALPKQYHTLAGRNMLHHTLAAFDACPELAHTLVVLSPDDQHFDPRRFAGLRFSVRRCGGATRQATVLNGLDELSGFGARDTDWALVHDAARPGLTPALIRALIAAVKDDPVGGILALPQADTVKRERAQPLVVAPGPVNRSVTLPRIGQTESREGLWQAQTPQMFRIGMLRGALRAAASAGRAVTDEASAIEMLGHAPILVRGSPRNFKVTYPEDFELAEAILSGSKKPT
ncbi:MAG: 2-C-methyl-D-erythritol 4-phosphate cytidylyltransferase [Janthinobacterium lividum]